MDRKKHLGVSRHLLIEPLESRQLLSSSANIVVSPSLVISASATSSGTIEGYSPAQIKAAYGISSIRLGGVSGTGAGQTIAIVDAYSDPNIASDLAVFDKEFGLSAASLTQVSTAGSTTKLPSSDAGWDGEISLDVEWAHAIAPKAKIILVDASSDSLSSLMAAVKSARTISSVSVISMSWGSSEFSGETSYDKYFTTPSGHIGITFVAASGDDGASGGAEWPASSPNVLSVGGTTLSLSSTGAVESESAWSDGSGGVSSYESTPSYQSAVSTTGRSTPDVSYNADPNTGFAVYDSVADDGSVGWQEVGGTSAGTPQWAALIAIADQGRVANGLSSLDGATGTLPAIYSIYSNSTSYAADFSDITTGSSMLFEGGGGGFGGGLFGGGPFGGRGRSSQEVVTATTGYDTLTGLGTPKAAALVEALASATVSKSSVMKTTASSNKSIKTKAAAATAVAAIEIEIERAGSTFNLASFSLAASTSIRRSQTNVEIETTPAAATAATIAPARPAGPDGVTLSRSVSPMDTQKPAAEDALELAENKTLFAQPPIEAAGWIAHPAILTSSSASQDAAPQAAFSETAIARDFRDALNAFAEECADIPAVNSTSKSSSAVLSTSVGIAIDAVLIGYFYARRKPRVAGESIFSDDACI